MNNQQPYVIANSHMVRERNRKKSYVNSKLDTSADMNSARYYVFYILLHLSSIYFTLCFINTYLLDWIYFHLSFLTFSIVM